MNLKTLIEEYKSSDIVTHNKAVEKLSMFYSSVVLDYAIQNEGQEFAFELAKTLLSYYDHLER